MMRTTQQFSVTLPIEMANPERGVSAKQVRKRLAVMHTLPLPGTRCDEDAVE
jgi:hypothetical protein